MRSGLQLLPALDLSFFVALEHGPINTVVVRLGAFAANHDSTMPTADPAFPRLVEDRIFLKVICVGFGMGPLEMIGRVVDGMYEGRGMQSLAQGTVTVHAANRRPHDLP